MARFSWRRWVQSLSTPRHRPFRGTQSLRPRFDELEFRLAPASLTWTGAGPTSDWSTGANWDLNRAPEDGDDLVFGAGVSKLNITNDIDDLVINSLAFSGNGYVLGGKAIVLGTAVSGTGYITVNGAGISDTINFDMTLGGASGDKQFFTVNSNVSTLLIGGKISGTTGVELSKDGTGVLILSADNGNFNGPISITEGALNARNANALGDTAHATTVLYNTTTGKFGQLQIENVSGAIAEPLLLNGSGPLNDGALLSVAGNNLLTGAIRLDSDVTVGASAGTMTLQGVIGDLGAGHNLTKEGRGRVVLDPINAPGTPAVLTGNAYRGRTFVNNGILAIRHSLALGNDPVPVQGVNDTVVQSATDRSGTLQLDFLANPLRIDPNAAAGGFTVPTESLILNGPGFEGIHVLPKDHLVNGGGTVSGALNNLRGTNTWVQDISLWSSDSSILFNARVWEWGTVGIGAEAGSDLIIAGHVLDNLISGTPDLPTVPYSLIKTRPGRVVFVDSNTYRGRTEILEGYLNIRDSRALGVGGQAGNGTIVFQQATLELEADSRPDSAAPYAPQPDGTLHLDTDIVIAGGGEDLALMGTGAGNDGALRNIRGTNEITGGVPLLTFIGRGNTPVAPAAPAPVVVRTPFVPTFWAATFTDTGASIGVQPDRAPFGQFDLSQLTLSGVIRDAQDVAGAITGGGPAHFTKVGTGELVLTDSANVYNGDTYILQGWVTARNNRSLGADFTTQPDTLQPATYVAQGAALHLKQTRSLTPAPLTISERVFLSGNGFDHRFPELNRRGALENLSGQNTYAAIVNLVATDAFAQVGLGADIANNPGVPADLAVTRSELSFVNMMQEQPFAANLANGLANTLLGAGIAPPATNAAGINKLGRKRIYLQGMGTFTGDNTITEGTLRVQSETALGMLTGTTTVLNGSAIEIKGYATTSGPSPTVNHTLNGGLTGGVQVRENLVLSGPGNVTADDPTHNFSDPAFRVDTLTSVSDDNSWRSPITFATDVNVRVGTDSRLSLWKTIDGAGGFVKNGTGKLVLGGVNTYAGVTNVNTGVVNLQSSSALGSAAGGTFVSNNAQIELQGDITIAGESLTVLGRGPTQTPVIPVRWFAQGPGPITGTPWVGGTATGRVTGVAVDPNDPNILYLSAAGGGAWRSLNNGLTWQPLIDKVDGVPVSVDQVLFTGAIAVSPANSNVIYVALGEANNSNDSYYGRGVLMSTDFGRSWTLIQPPATGGFDRRTISRIVADPVEATTVYVAVEGDAAVNTAAPGNYGIWRFRNNGWVNLTAGVTTPVVFSQTAHSYTDLQVFNANPRITVNDSLHPNQPNRRVIAFAIGSPTGFNAGSPTSVTDNAVYTSIDADTTNNAPTWTSNSFPTGVETVAGVPGQPRNGMIKIGGVRSNANRDTIVIYAAVTFPNNFPRLVSGEANRFREINVSTVSFDPNTNLWTAGAWGAVGAQPAGANAQGPLVGRGSFASTIAVHSQRVGTPAGLSLLGNPNFVFFGGTGSSPTLSGPFVYDGTAWNTQQFNGDGSAPHTEYHASFFDRTGRLVVGNDGGVWRMENATAPGPNAANWINLNSNGSATSLLQITQFNGLDVHPFDPFFAVGGSAGNGTAIYNDSSTWTAVEGVVNGVVDPGEVDSGVLRVNNKNPQIMFHVLNGELRRSTTGGAAGSWSTVYQTAPRRQYFPFILDRVNPSRVLLGDGTDLWQSNRDGEPGSFVIVGAATSNPDGLGSIRGIAVSDRQGTWANDPGFPLVLDRGAESYDSETIYVISNSGVHVTKNQGQAWLTRNNGLITTSLADITVDPRDRDTAYVVRSVFTGGNTGHVFRTQDGGQTWVDISGDLPDLPTWKVVVNPRNGDVFIGNDNGVYVLKGGSGTNWVRFGDGLPNVQIKELVINTYTNMLSAGTYGRGLFQVWLDDSRADSGVLRAVTGSSLWTGSVTMTGTSYIGADIGAQLNISGTVSSPDSSFELHKVGVGKLVLSGANTYGGITDVEQGTLNSRNPSALGDPAAKTVVRTGAALELQADLFGETVELNGDGVNINGHNTGALRNVSNNNTFTGTIKLITGSTIGVDSGSQLTVGTKAGNPGAGTGTIDDGALTRTLTKELAGTLVLNAANTYDGRTDVIQGILRVEHGSALGSGLAGTQVRDGAQLQLNRDTAGNPITVAGEVLTLSGTGVNGTGALQNVAGSNTWQGGVVLTAIQGVAAPPPPVPPSTVVINVVGGNDTLTIDGSVGELAVTIPAQPPLIPAPVTINSFGLTKVGFGRLTLKQADSYSGLTTVQVGTLNIQHNLALGTTSAGTLVNVGATLEMENNITVTGESLTLGGNGVGLGGALRNVAGANTWNGPVVMVSNTTIGVNAGSQLTTVNGATGITTSPGTANFSLTVNPLAAETGTLVFAGPNSYAGATNVSNGVLNIRNAASLGPAGSAGTTVASGATLQLQGGITVSSEDLTISGPGFNGAGALENFSGDNAWARTLVLAANAAIGVTGAGDTLSIPVAINDGGAGRSVTKVGPGTLSYTGTVSNEYTGPTLVNAGTLLLDKTGGAIGVRGNLTVGDGTAGAATARWNQNDQIPDGLTVTVNSDGTMDLNGKTETIAVLNVRDGRVTTGTPGDGLLTVATTADLRGGTVDLATAGGRLILGGSVSAEAASTTAVITGPGLVSLNGADRTFTVTRGPLAGSDLRVESGILNTAAEDIVKAGNGVMEITADITPTFVDGVITINAGTLQVGGKVNDVRLNGGTLSGNGTVALINADAVNGGTVSPGSPAGALGTLKSGSTLLTDTSTFFINLDRDVLNSPVGDLLEVTGDVSLGNATLAGVVSDNVLINDQFTIITTTGQIVGQFGNEVNGIVFISFRKFGVTYNNNSVVLTRLQNTATVDLVSNSNPSVYGEDVKFTATVTPEPGAGSIPTTDTVTFTFFNHQTSVTTTRSINVDTNNQAAFDPVAEFGAPLDIGNYTVSAQFNANGADVNFNSPTSNTVDQRVNKTSTSLALGSSANPSVYGQTVTITATVTALIPGTPLAGRERPGGTVTFTVDNVDQAPVPVDASGKATIDLSNLSVNVHQITAVYSGDTRYVGSSSSTLSQQVNRATSRTGLVASPSPSRLGETVRFTATISAVAPGSGTPTGNVVFVLNGTTPLGNRTLDNGVAFIDVSNLQLGTHTITANYSGDGNFTTSTKDVSHTVNRALSMTDIVSNVNPSFVGQAVTFTVTVAGQPPAPTGVRPSGDVRILIDGALHDTIALDGSGKAVFTVSSLTFGSHTIQADYQGDVSFEASTDSMTQVVKGRSTTTVVSSKNPSVFGEPVTFTATVSSVAPVAGTPTGTVTFVIDGAAHPDSPHTLDANGQATVTIPSFTIGTHTVRVDYSGDNNFVPSSSSTLSQQVNKGNSTTSITPSVSPSVFGQSVTFTIDVTANPPTPGTPTGDVRIFVDGVQQGPDRTLVAGQTSFTVSNLAAGPHAIRADYLGDAIFATSTRTITHTVNKAATTTTISSSSPNSVGPPTVTAQVTTNAPGNGTPSGTVRFNITGSVSATDFETVDGTGKATLRRVLKPGSYTITATYLGATNFNPSPTSAPLSQNVAKASTTTDLTTSNADAVYGEPVFYTATVTTNAPGSGTPAGTVSFFVDNVFRRTVRVDANGKAVMADRLIAARPGSPYTIRATYNPTESYNTSTDSVTQTINKATTTTTVTPSKNPITAGEAVTFNVVVRSNAPGTLPPTGYAYFYHAGKKIGQATLTRVFNPNGTVTDRSVASFTTRNLPVGDQAVAVLYSPNNASFTLSRGFTSVHVDPNPVVYNIVPSNVRSGDVLRNTNGRPLEVLYLRSNGTVDTSYNGPVTVAINTAPALRDANGNVIRTGRIYAGTTTRNAVNGVARFDDLVFDVAGDYTLRATADGNPPVVSPKITILARGLAARTVQSVISAEAVFSILVRAVDVNGATAANYNGSVTIRLASGPTGGTLTPNPATGTISNGSGVIGGLKVNKSGTYTLRITSGTMVTTLQLNVLGRRF